MADLWSADSRVGLRPTHATSLAAIGPLLWSSFPNQRTELQFGPRTNGQERPSAMSEIV